MGRRLREEILVEAEQLLGVTFGKDQHVTGRICAKFGISTRQAKRYIAEVRRRLAETSEVNRDERRVWIRNQFETLYQRCLRDRHWRSAKEMLVEMVRLDGLDSPTRIEMKHLGVDVEQGRLTSYDAIKARLEELRGAADKPN